MKQLLWGAFAALAIACGGGAKKPTEPQPKSACAVAAEHTASELVAAEADGLDENERAGLVRVITERCETDAWSNEAVACITNAKAADGGFERCDDMLTEAQIKAAEEQLNREVMGPARERMNQQAPGGGAGSEPDGDGAKPPPPPDDPCGGGA
jgi:hypothetical protein